MASGSNPGMKRILLKSICQVQRQIAILSRAAPKRRKSAKAETEPSTAIFNLGARIQDDDAGWAGTAGGQRRMMKLRRQWWPKIVLSRNVVLREVPLDHRARVYSSASRDEHLLSSMEGMMQRLSRHSQVAPYIQTAAKAPAYPKDTQPEKLSRGRRCYAGNRIP